MKKPDRKVVAASLAFLVGAATASALGPQAGRHCPAPEGFDRYNNTERVMLKMPEKKLTSLGGI